MVTVWLKGLMFVVLIAFSAIRAPTAVAATLSEEALNEGSISLFDGETLFGWKAASKADWQVVDGEIRVDAGEPGLLCTTTQFADYVLRVDFRAAADTNSGIFLRTSPRPKNVQGDCYELNIAPPANPFPTGSFVGRKKVEPALAVDLMPMNVMCAKLCINHLRKDKQSLDEDLTASYYVYVNRREGPYEDIEQLGLNAGNGKPHILSWQGKDLKRNKACPVCGDNYLEEMSKIHGISVSPADIDKYKCKTGK